MQIIRNIEQMLKFYPNEVKNKKSSLIWGQSRTIFHQTLQYLDRIKAKVYIVIVENAELKHFIKFSPLGIPESMKITYNNQLHWTPYEKQQLQNQKNIDVMNCVIHPNKKESTDKHMYERILREVLKKHLAPVPNGAYVFSLRDAVLLRKDGCYPYTNILKKKMKNFPTKFLPLFNTTCHEDYWDMPIPTYDDFMFVHFKQPDLSSAILDFSQKLPIAIFRGSATGCGYTESTNMRIKLAKIAKEGRYRFLNAGITASGKRYRYDPVYGLGYFSHILTKIPPIKPVPKVEQSKYKYVIYIEGNVAAYRLPIDMQLGSVILLVKSAFHVWMEKFMKEWVHYVPVEHDLSDLITKIEWCIQHEQECSQIAKNGLELSSRLLREDVLYAFIAKSLASF